MFRITFLGPIGSGKGTQAKMLSDFLHVPTISPGAMYRKHIAEGTELGKLANNYIQKGHLVPDSITLEMMQKRLAKNDTANGFILDGFPRTLGQAQGFEEFSSFDLAIFIDVSDKESLHRLVGRRSCINGHVYHVDYNPPKKDGICDIDGDALVQREDDQPQAIQQRLRVFHKQVKPVIDYFREKGILHNVDGTPKIEEVAMSIQKFINL